MALLRELGIIERLVGGLEIGAAVLPVGVEEQRVELAVEIVVVRDVAPRARARIELPDAAREVAGEASQSRPRRKAAVAMLTEQDRKHVRDRALLDHDTAVHVGFAESQ